MTRVSSVFSSMSFSVAGSGDDHVERDPHGEEPERGEHEGPRPHAVAHVVGGLVARRSMRRRHRQPSLPAVTATMRALVADMYR
jgi:hypothetical protein